MTCFLKKIQNVDPLLLPANVLNSDHSSRLFDGLILKDDKLILDVSFFECCDGSGNFFEDGSTMGTGIVARCGIGHRYSRTLGLFDHYKRLFHNATLDTLGADQIAFLTKWAESFKNGEKFGQAIQIESSKNSVMWPVALFFSWHMNLKPKIVYLSEEFESSIFDGLENFDFILLDGLSKLWDTTERLKLDRLINYCFSSMIPLWIFFPKTAEKRHLKKAASRNLRLFENKIAKLKAQNPIDLLSESSFLKLKDICLGTERISSRS